MSTKLAAISQRSSTSASWVHVSRPGFSPFSFLSLSTHTAGKSCDLCLQTILNLTAFHLLASTLPLSRKPLCRLWATAVASWAFLLLLPCSSLLHKHTVLSLQRAWLASDHTSSLFKSSQGFLLRVKVTVPWVFRMAHVICHLHLLTLQWPQCGKQPSRHLFSF